MERRFVNQQRANVRIEKREDGTEIIAGYAAVFYNAADPGTEYELWPAYGTWPRAVERILPGAFDGRLADDVRGLFNHSPNLVLGRNVAGTMKLSVDGTGLRYEITPGKTTAAADVLEHLRRGDVDGSSFSFSVKDQRWTESKELEVREILAIEALYDVGPVTFPAYAATTAAAAVRSARTGETADEARRAWDAWKKERAALNARILDYRARALNYEP